MEVNENTQLLKIEYKKKLVTKQFSKNYYFNSIHIDLKDKFLVYWLQYNNNEKEVKKCTSWGLNLCYLKSLKMNHAINKYISE